MPCYSHQVFMHSSEHGYQSAQGCSSQQRKLQCKVATMSEPLFPSDWSTNPAYAFTQRTALTTAHVCAHTCIHVAQCAHTHTQPSYIHTHTAILTIDPSQYHHRWSPDRLRQAHCLASSFNGHSAEEESLSLGLMSWSVEWV